MIKRGPHGAPFFKRLRMNWKEVVFGTFGLGVLGLMWQVIRYWLGIKSKRERQADRFHDVISKVAEVYDIIHEFIHQSSASRCAILKLTNGGGMPKLGAHLQTSVIYESYIGNTPSLKRRIQGFVVDESYIRMMQVVVTEGSYHQYTAEMDEGFYKDLLLSGHMEFTKVIHLVTHPKYLLYMTVEFENTPQKGDPELGADLAILTDRLRKLFAKIDLE